MIWNKYSQFPWKLQVNEHGAPIKEIVANDGRAVCEVYECDSPDAVWNNAALLAAAPELLEALKGYMSAVDQMNLAMDDGVNVQAAISAITGWADMANAAISKATGQ